MSWFSVDCECDGPDPLGYNLIEIGAVLIDPERKLNKTFHSSLCPRTGNFVQEALDVTNTKREDTYDYLHPELAMMNFKKWIEEVNIKGRPRMLADNAGFDWMFINTYFHQYGGENPFGFSCFSLTSGYQMFVKKAFASFKHLRITKHTHDPVDDAMGNAEAFLTMIDMGFECRL